MSRPLLHPSRRPARVTPMTGLPPEPVARCCERYMRAHSLNRTDFAKWLGISEKTLRRWSVSNYDKRGSAPTVSLEPTIALIHWVVVDEVLTKLDVLWFDAYDDVRYPEAHARAAVLLGGEREAVAV